MTTQEIAKYAPLHVVTLRSGEQIFVPSEEAQVLMDRVDKGHGVKIGEEYYAAGEVRTIRKHVVKEGSTAKDVLHEFQGQEREWVRWRIKDRMEKVGKALTAEEARRFVQSVRENPDLAPC